MSHPNNTSDFSGNLITPFTDRHPESKDPNNNNVNELTLATNHGDDVQNTQFPSFYKCPITLEPPTLGVTFLDHSQVFEYSSFTDTFAHLVDWQHSLMSHTQFHVS